MRLHNCSTIRLKGTTNLITLYGFDGQFLVLYAKMDEKDLADFDPSDADEKLSIIVTDLRDAIKALIDMVYA